MTIPTRIIFGLILTFGLVIGAHSQKTTDVDYYNIFDQTIGVENTETYQGVLYSAEFRTNIDKTEFFKNLDFTKGSIFYDGQPYHDLDIKYDINKDRVLMKLAAKAGGGTLILFNDILQRFEIGDSRFVKLDAIETAEIGITGFYEVSAENPFFTLFTKYNKKEVRQMGEKTVLHEFVDTPSTYVFFFKNRYHNINSKKEVKKLFPSLKTEIDNFYGDVKRLRRSDPEGFQVALANRLEILLSEQANQ